MMWIPMSKRLPENGHYYLWCSDMGHVQSDYYWDGFEEGQKYGYNIVAWMPLPKPYTADRETEPQYDIDKGTIKCDNCSENGSYKCTKCDGEIYFKRLEVEDESQTEREDE